MNVRGKNVALLNTFNLGSVTELRERLQQLGAHVDLEVSDETEMVFCGEDGWVDLFGEAGQRGVPIFSEESLFDVLSGDGRTETATDGPFPDAEVLSSATGPAALLTVLQEANWAAFAADRDLPPLRERLLRLEREHGIVEAHRLATQRLREQGARLRDPNRGFESNYYCFALSPCGRHLALGRQDTDDSGELQVWEMTTGRLVNAISDVDGGVGWSGHPDTIQWSADSSRIALAFCTNLVGLWDPFGERANPYGVADVSGGSDSPLPFALAPDGRQAYILGCTAALDRGYVDDGNHESHNGGPARESLPDQVRQQLDGFTLDFSQVWWSRDGSYLLGCGNAWNDQLHGGSWTWAMDVTGKRLRWAARTGDHVVWSPDERMIASIDIPPAQSRGGTGRLSILDAHTGTRVCEPVEQPEGSLHWGTQGRLAVTRCQGAGVDVYDGDGDYRYHLDIPVTPDIGLGPFGEQQQPWAWAPSAGHAACLTADARVEVWSLRDQPHRLRSFPVPEKTTAVLWGAGDVIAAIGAHILRFVHAPTGDVVGNFQIGMDGPNAVSNELYDLFRTNPFPLDESTWCATASPARGAGADLVIAPDGRRADLDTVLAWVVDRRFAWPVRWGPLTVVPDTDTARAVLIQRLAGGR